MITSFAAPRNYASIPFVGLAEALVVKAFRKRGVSLQHIRKAIDVLNVEMDLDHALASRRLYTDGAHVLYDYAEREGDEELEHLTVVVSQQRVFAPVVVDYLQRITYDRVGWPTRLVSPVAPVIEVDPTRSFGQPIFVHGAVRVEDVLDRWRAGERLADVAADFGVPEDDVEDVLRATLPAAA